MIGQVAGRGGEPRVETPGLRATGVATKSACADCAVLFYILLLGMLLVLFLFSRIWYDLTLAGRSFLLLAVVGIRAVILFFFYAYVCSSKPYSTSQSGPDLAGRSPVI